MRTLALYTLVALLPTAVFAAALLSLRGSRWLAESRRKPPPAQPPDKMAARLRRLRAELEATEASPRLTAKNHHVRALRGAYLDELRAACVRLEVSLPPGGDQARQSDIYRAEAALRDRGLDVRETAAR